MKTSQIAEKLGHPVRRVEERLGKLAMYGEIDRRIVRSPGGAPSRWSEWSSA